MIHKNWQELIKPNKLDVNPGTDPKRVATVVAEPLERGFGLTLGNALRRVLLSSLQGAAVKAVQIDGVLHEFSPIKGVVEDATDIILNLKQLPLKCHVDHTKTLTLRVDKPGPVRDHLAELQTRWQGMMIRSAQIAIQEGHFRADLDPKQFAYELQGIFLTLNYYRRLLRDGSAVQRAEQAFTQLLARSAAIH